MCMGHGGPPYGFPIPLEIHEQYPKEVQMAWKTFDDWWKQESGKGEPVKRSAMTEDVWEALQLILKTPIPTYEGPTGADSCYMRAVLPMIEGLDLSLA